MDRLDKATDVRIEKLKRKLEKQKETKIKNRAERKNLLKRKKYKEKAKEVIVIKSIMDVPITKSELIAIKHVLIQYIKKNPFFKNKFTYDKDDTTDRYHYNLYSNVFKAYNKLNDNDENKPIYQIKLV
jgi:hypothetical protein